MSRVLDSRFLEFADFRISHLRDFMNCVFPEFWNSEFVFSVFWICPTSGLPDSGFPRFLNRRIQRKKREGGGHHNNLSRDEAKPGTIRANMIDHFEVGQNLADVRSNLANMWPNLTKSQSRCAVVGQS